MRHRRIGRKLGVVTKHRGALLRNMVTDFLRLGRIQTTDTRAKELRRFAEKLITIAKRGTLQARRQAASIIRDKETLKKLFDEIAQRYKNRPGGYTRIVKLGVRRGDNAPISIIELVEETLEPKRRKRQKTAPKGQTPVKETAEAKSRKKESAEELGLVGAEGEKPKETMQEATSESPEKTE